MYMRFNRKLLAALMVFCMVLGTVLPASAATLQANYGEANYYDIAVTNYSRMLMFHNGVVVAANKDKQYGLIDASGKTVVPFQYGGIWYLGGNLYKIANSGDSYADQQGVIDSTGKVLVELSDCSINCYNNIVQVSYSYDNASYYTLDWTAATQEDYYGYNDTDPSIPAALSSYQNVYEIADGLYELYQEGKSAIADAKNNIIVPWSEKYINTIETDNGVFFLSDGQLLDSTGKAIISA
jgi:hypothetical protein